jgi:hypothetical protein
MAVGATVGGRVLVGGIAVAGNGSVGTGVGSTFAQASRNKAIVIATNVPTPTRHIITLLPPQGPMTMFNIII